MLIRGDVAAADIKDEDEAKPLVDAAAATTGYVCCNCSGDEAEMADPAQYPQQSPRLT